MTYQIHMAVNKNGDPSYTYKDRMFWFYPKDGVFVIVMGAANLETHEVQHMPFAKVFTREAARDAVRELALHYAFPDTGAVA